MCISFWLLEEHPVYSLVLALNRDEFYSRPTLPVHFWEEQTGILGGRDLQEGGTWMGINTVGRFALLTNVREDKLERDGNKVSRGSLPTQFLRSDKSPRSFLEEITSEADRYSGFNLVVADVVTGEMAYFSNRKGSGYKVEDVPHGLYALSNGGLHSKWWKMERGKAKFYTVLSEFSIEEVLQHRIMEEVLKDGTQSDDVSVQQAETGQNEELERLLSSIFVDGFMNKDAYGTRSMVVLTVRRDGKVTCFESYLEQGVWKNHDYDFRILGPKQT